MRMLSIARFAVILTIVLTVSTFASSRAHAQGDPAAITGLTSNRTPFTPDEAARIRAFGTHWVERFTRDNASPENVDDARRRLMEPLRGRGQSDLFLNEYGDIILQGLVASVDRDTATPHTAANALVIISRIGTERALDALIDRSSVRTTSSTPVRISAARGARELLRQADTSRISIRKRQQVARRLRDAAAAETDAFALRHHLHAIFYCDREGVDQETRAEMLGQLAGALTSVADRSGESVLLLDATTAVVFDVLQRFLQLDSTSQGVSARALTPGLMRLLDAYERHGWTAETNQADAGRFSRQVARVERCLQTMLPFAHPNRSIPTTNLQAAWAAKDLARFRSELELWKQATR